MGECLWNSALKVGTDHHEMILGSEASTQVWHFLLVCFQFGNTLINATHMILKTRILDSKIWLSGLSLKSKNPATFVPGHSEVWVFHSPHLSLMYSLSS